MRCPRLAWIWAPLTSTDQPRQALALARTMHCQRRARFPRRWRTELAHRCCRPSHQYCQLVKMTSSALRSMCRGADSCWSGRPRRCPIEADWTRRQARRPSLVWLRLLSSVGLCPCILISDSQASLIQARLAISRLFSAHLASLAISSRPRCPVSLERLR